MSYYMRGTLVGYIIGTIHAIWKPDNAIVSLTFLFLTFFCFGLLLDDASPLFNKKKNP